ncbi:hypothetical protein M1437_01180 [Patescibacteria group bacterium]|nr:hypothetical protein [Patescibacteria group bacterium]
MPAEKPTFEVIFRDFKLILTCTYQGVGCEPKEAPWNNATDIGVSAAERLRQVKGWQKTAQTSAGTPESKLPYKLPPRSER